MSKPGKVLKRRKFGKKTTRFCPHMGLINGKYVKATKNRKLLYKGKKYSLYTCCLPCALGMNALAITNPRKFKKTYIKKEYKNGNLSLKHKDTKKVVQKAILYK